jgi:hypothetical protein
MECIALSEFMDCFETVFGSDWEITQGHLVNDLDGDMISPDGTFPQPGVSDTMPNLTIHLPDEKVTVMPNKRTA